MLNVRDISKKPTLETFQGCKFFRDILRKPMLKTFQGNQRYKHFKETNVRNISGKPMLNLSMILNVCAWILKVSRISRMQNVNILYTLKVITRFRGG